MKWMMSECFIQRAFPAVIYLVLVQHTLRKGLDDYKLGLEARERETRVTVKTNDVFDTK